MEKMAAALVGMTEFVAAADTGSFSAAARALGLSVAHVSRRVAELERGLGVQLIQRTSRRSVLTEAGRSYHASCRALLDGLAEARDTIRSDRDELRGPIRISVGGHFAEWHLTPLLLRFAREHPLISLEIEVSGRNTDLVEEGFDFAVRAGPLAASSLISRRLVAFPLSTMASPVLLAESGEPEHPDALKPSLCLSLGRRRWSFRRDGDERVLAPLGRVHSNDGSTLVQAAVAGMGVVQLPGYYGRAEVANGALVPILEDWTPNDPFEFYLVYPPQRRLPQRIRRLLDFLVQELA